MTEDRRSRLLALIEHMQTDETDLIARLNAHEERLDELDRLRRADRVNARLDGHDADLGRIRQAIEDLRAPRTAEKIDQEALRAICAWIGHVKFEGVTHAESWDHWTLSAPSGRCVTVEAVQDGIRVTANDPSGGLHMDLWLAEAHEGDLAAAAGQWLRGGVKVAQATQDVAVGDAVTGDAATAALAFVQSLQKLVAPVDVVSSPNQWTLIKNGRRLLVSVSSRPDDHGFHIYTDSASFRVSATDSEALRESAEYLRS